MTTELRMTSGETFALEGSLEDVEKALSDAARSGQSRLAWLDKAGGGRVAVNPTQVTSLQVTEDPPG